MSRTSKPGGAWERAQAKAARDDALVSASNGVVVEGALSDGDRRDLRSAVRALEAAQQAVNDQQVELEYVKLQIRKRYTMGPFDEVNLDTGVITRKPMPGGSVDHG